MSGMSPMMPVPPWMTKVYTPVDLVRAKFDWLPWVMIVGGFTIVVLSIFA